MMTNNPLMLHLISNSHLDHVWLWRWQEGCQEARATLASAADRMDEYPEFVFTVDSVAYLAIVEEIDPELFERLRARVAEGRCVPVGGWWVEPDCNLPSGESLVRQGLYGQRWLKERFGNIAVTGSNLDPFGHPATLPQILSGQGMNGYVFFRPTVAEKVLPDRPFRWRSADGSEVVACRIPVHYGSDRGELDTKIRRVREIIAADGGHALFYYGVGNHGGGPTKANLEYIRDLISTGAAVEHSTPPRFFDTVRASGIEFPVVSDELQIQAVGCYTANSELKSLHRRAENTLLAAEKWAVVAARTTATPYPRDELTAAWKNLLLNQFHDILAGTTIRRAADDAIGHFREIIAIAERALNRSQQQISRRIAIPAEPTTFPVVVFNPHPWPVTTTVEHELSGCATDNLIDTDARILDDTGQVMPAQRIQSEAVMGDIQRRYAFGVDLPPLGYRSYRLQQIPAVPRPYRSTRLQLENDHLRMEVDPGTGWLRSLVITATGQELIGTAAPHAAVVEDPSDTWSHGVTAFGRPSAHFIPESSRLIEDGPLRSTVRVTSSYGSSELIEDLILHHDTAYVEVRARLDWREHHQLLKLRFPTTLTSPTATHEIPYGQFERPCDGTEFPVQNWLDVTGALPESGRAGLTIINDGKYGADVNGADIGMTITRSPIYAWHHPGVPDRVGRYDYLDQGPQRFSYRLLPHTGDLDRAGATRAGLEFNQQPVLVTESFHPGPLPLSQSFGNDGGGSVIVTVVKGAEDGGTIVRAYETTGQRTDATIDLPLLGRKIWAAHFTPHQIKTFHIPEEPHLPIRELNLLEFDDEQPP